MNWSKFVFNVIKNTSADRVVVEYVGSTPIEEELGKIRILAAVSKDPNRYNDWQERMQLYFKDARIMYYRRDSPRKFGKILSDVKKNLDKATPLICAKIIKKNSHCFYAKSLGYGFKCNYETLEPVGWHTWLNLEKTELIKPKELSAIML